MLLHGAPEGDIPGGSCGALSPPTVALRHASQMSLLSVWCQPWPLAYSYWSCNSPAPPGGSAHTCHWNGHLVFWDEWPNEGRVRHQRVL